MTGTPLPDQNRRLWSGLWFGLRQKLSRTWLIGLTVVAATGLFVGGYFVTLKQVQIHVDGQEMTLHTHARTVAAALAQAHVQLEPEDAVTPGLTASLAGRTGIEVSRAVPVQVTVDGSTRTIKTVATTVGRALQAAGIPLAESVQVQPDADTPVAPAMQIIIKQLTFETASVQEAIPFDTVRREDAGLELGRERVVQAGEAGLRQVTVRKTLADGKEIASQVLDSQVIKAPRAQIVAYGTVGEISRGGQVVRFRKALVLTATGYTAGVESNPWATGYTYTGLKATRGVVAVDPRVIPLGSRLYVEDYGFAIAADIGGAIKGNRIDLCFDTVREADDYGLRRGIKVYILE